MTPLHQRRLNSRTMLLLLTLFAKRNQPCLQKEKVFRNDLFVDKGGERVRRPPTNRNFAPKVPTFGALAGVSSTGVQWESLAPGEPPW